MNVTKELCEFIEGVSFEDLPDETITLAKPLILDSFGVAIAGNACPIGKIAADLGRESAGRAEATVIGANYMTSVSSAAFVNGTLAHALDMDDSAAGTVAHPSSPIVPALLALAEKFTVSGKELLTAYILGLEVFYRIALASNGQMGGWHRTSLFGAFAAAAASAKLLRLQASEIQTAIGIAMSLTGGVQVNFGTMTKAVQVGNASRSGVVAALMTKKGCTAHDNVLGDSIGLGNTFYAGEFDEKKIVSDLGAPYSIVFPGIGMKIYPCCGLTHCPADLVLDLVATHDIDIKNVSHVTVFAEKLLPEVLIHDRPTTGYQGKYSLQYVVAAAMLDRQITFETFTDSMVNRPEVQAHLEKVRCIVRSDAEWEPVRLHEWNHAAEVCITLLDGTNYSASAPCAKGYPDKPLNSAEVMDKFRTCAGQILPANAVASLGQKILGIEAEENMTDIMSLASVALP